MGLGSRVYHEDYMALPVCLGIRVISPAMQPDHDAMAHTLNRLRFKAVDVASRYHPRTLMSPIRA